MRRAYRSPDDPRFDPTGREAINNVMRSQRRRREYDEHEREAVGDDSTWRDSHEASRESYSRSDL